jgi:hypothetical protein
VVRRDLGEGGAQVTERDDRYSERRELLGAGWEPKDAEGTVVWKSPANGYWYPQDLALQLAREQAGNHVPNRRGGETP